MRVNIGVRLQMTPERLARWLLIIGLLGCTAAQVNEQNALTEYYAIDQETGRQVKYEAIKFDAGIGYLIMKSTYEDSHPQPTDEPVHQIGYYVQDFGRLRKWLKKEKRVHPDLHKRTRRIGFVK
jgi:hypothetical protein